MKKVLFATSALVLSAGVAAGRLRAQRGRRQAGRCVDMQTVQRGTHGAKGTRRYGWSMAAMCGIAAGRGLRWVKAPQARRAGPRGRIRP